MIDTASAWHSPGGASSQPPAGWPVLEMLMLMAINPNLHQDFHRKIIFLASGKLKDQACRPSGDNALELGSTLQPGLGPTGDPKPPLPRTLTFLTGWAACSLWTQWLAPPASGQLQASKDTESQRKKGAGLRSFKGYGKWQGPQIQPALLALVHFLHTGA